MATRSARPNYEQETAQEHPRVATLIRVSTLAQAKEDRYGIAAQQSIVDDIVSHNGLEVVRQFQIAGTSGAEMLNDPRTYELLDMVEAGKIDGVVVRAFDRLMRPEDYGDYKIFQVFQKYGVKLWMPTGAIDLRDKMGRAQANMLATLADFERDAIRDRTTSGKRKAMLAGRLRPPVLALGVNFERPDRWSYTEDAEQVRDCFRRVLAGESLRTVARWLGKRPSGVRAILHNKIYAGFVVHGLHRYEKGEGGRLRRVKPTPGTVYERQVFDAPLVTIEQWNRVQQILKVASEGQGRLKRGGPAKFNGLLFCDHCGSLLTPMNGPVYKGRKIHYYGCSRLRPDHPQYGQCNSSRIPADLLESEFVRFLSEVLPSREFAARLKMQIENRKGHVVKDARASRIAHLEKELKRAETRRENTILIFRDGDISRERKIADVAAFDKQIAELSEQLATERGALLPEMTEKQILGAFQVLRSAKVLPLESLRKVLAVTVPRTRILYTLQGRARNAKRSLAITTFYWMPDAQWVTAPGSTSAFSAKDRQPQLSVVSTKCGTGAPIQGFREAAHVERALPHGGFWITNPAA